MGDPNELVERLTKEAALGNNVYSPWPQKMLNEAAAALTSLIAERDGLEAALNWALGCKKDFRQRAEGEGAYWWRKELAERAGMTYDRDAGIYRRALSLDTNKGDGV